MFRKTNNIVLHGVIIVDDTQESGIYPTIYIDQYLKDYQSDKMTIEEIVDEVIMANKEHKEDLTLDVKILKDFRCIKDKLAIKLINTEKNEELLKNVPHKDFLDLSIVYQIIMTVDMNGIGTVTINNNWLAMYGITEDELHEAAVKNSQKRSHATIQSMFDVLFDMGMDIEEDDVPDVGMIVVSNERKINGASVVVYEDTLDKIAKKYKMNKFYVLPSSIHEVLAVKFSDELDVDYLRSMVREINSNEVAPDEVLSDNVYIYNAETKEFVVA